MERAKSRADSQVLETDLWERSEEIVLTVIDTIECADTVDFSLAVLHQGGDSGYWQIV